MSSRRNRLRSSSIDKLLLGTEDTVWKAINAASNYWLSLHTADPGLGGDQDTSEATYGGYGRISVSKGSGWTRSGDNVAYPAGAVTFAQCTTDTRQAVSYVGVGLSETGTGTLLWAFPLTRERTVVLDYQPTFIPTSLKLTFS